MPYFRFHKWRRTGILLGSRKGFRGYTTNRIFKKNFAAKYYRKNTEIALEIRLSVTIFAFLLNLFENNENDNLIRILALLTYKAHSEIHVWYFLKQS